MANEIKALNIGGTTYDIKPEFADNAGKVNSPLKAGTKSYDGSAEVTITASDLGLSSALKYIGTSSTKVSDGGTESPTINGSTYTIPEGSSGQVVFYDEKEFVWNGSTWEFLGDDRNFKVIQSPVSDPAVDDATSTTFIDAISQDANGLITATKKRLPSYLSTSGGTITGKLSIDASATGDSPLFLRSNKKDSEGACRIYFADSTNAFQGYVMTGWGNLILAHRSRNQIGVGDNGIWCSTDNGTTKNTLIHSGNIGSQNAGSANVIAKTYANENINYANNESKIRLIESTVSNSTELGFPDRYTSGISVMTDYTGWQMVTYSSIVFPNPFFRSFGDDGRRSEWRQLAFLDDNVASATKLQTARTIWGQSFDGTGNVSGNIVGGTKLFAIYGYDDNGNTNIIDCNGINKQLWIGYDSAAKSYNTELAGNNIYFHHGTSRSIGMVLNTSGNVLIGTLTDSGYKLNVNGTARINGNTTIIGTCSASSGFFETSDSRLKDFKDPVKVDLDKLSKLTKAYFTFKNDPEKMHLGVSAQEIQEIYPEIVNENEEGFLSVDYAKLSVIALTAVDELNNRLNSIEERLSRLEK